MNPPDNRPWIVALWRGMLLALEISGAGIILLWGVPFYRELLAGNFNQIEPRVRWWATIAIVLIQTGYWLRYRHQASPVLRRRVIAGHLSMFLARLNFIFTGGVFSAIFFVRYDQVIFSAGGAGLLFGILFSMFCVTLDFERSGAALLKGKEP
ncbi:hypothetical protein OKA05_17990 [Luteolibacter arcticus]|uniref:Uncharacterized protein n=1 Tax=Luteolibacter arcticus TaxID=1581411 RepID=A0ABT3GLT1_9BACT|nr:hypothetical protein [Luteolibacter arcticus]MCW1924463.1 hypothetical protein [Luteolibacter arcticus]